MLRRLMLCWHVACEVWRSRWRSLPPGAAIEVRMVRHWPAPGVPSPATMMALAEVDARLARLEARPLAREGLPAAPRALPPPAAPAPAPQPRTVAERRPVAPAPRVVAPAPRPLPPLRIAQPAVNVEAIVGGLKKLGYGPKTAQAAAAKAVAKGGDAGEIMRRALQCAQEG